MNWEDHFYYDESSPSGLRWKDDRRSGKNGARLNAAKDSPVGSKKEHGYKVHIGGKIFSVHRVIWEMFYETLLPTDIIDHIDGNPYNNKIDNLRVVDAKLNSRNRKKQTNNPTGVTGVYKITYKNPNNVEYVYFKAYWSDLEGNANYKIFSVHELGESQAFDAACSYRKLMIEKLNKQGAGYTNRHGL